MIFFHLIAFDIPYPANYGGAIDVFYKIKALHARGAKIILHCFQYGERTPQRELERYVEEIFYYERKTGFAAAITSFPYIVSSRMVNELAQNLLEYDFPILAEGLHCTGFFSHPQLADRAKFVRMHNVEWQYYASLKALESGLAKSVYYGTESKRLRKFEGLCLQTTSGVFTISEAEQAYFSENYPTVPSDCIPAFHPYDEVQPLNPGFGDFALFHGNLAVSDNELSALFLIEEVFSETDFPLIIAGRKPSDKLRRAVSERPNVTLKSDLSDAEMTALKRNAQIHVLYTLQEAGMKLKFIETLFTGRHCIANAMMTAGYANAAVVHTANDAGAFLEKIEKLRGLPFSEAEYKQRKGFLDQNFDNKRNAQKIIDRITK